MVSDIWVACVAATTLRIIQSSFHLLIIIIILRLYYFEHVMSWLQLIPKFCIHFNYLIITTMCNYFENITWNMRLFQCLKSKLILTIILAEEFVFFCLNSLISGALSRIWKIIFSFDGLILEESYWLFYIWHQTTILKS